MGQTPSQIESEIEGLRNEIDVIVDELEQRATVPNIVHGVTSSVARTAGSLVSEAEAEMPEVVRRNEPTIGGVALSILTGLGVFSLSSMLLGGYVTTSEKNFDRALGLRERNVAMDEDLDEVLAGAIRRARRARGAREISDTEEPKMFKKVLWAALAAGMAALGSMLFQRMTAQFWRKTMHEEPPK